MKKQPHKLPCELHDPHLDVPQYTAQDLSDASVTPPPAILPQPAQPPEISN